VSAPSATIAPMSGSRLTPSPWRIAPADIEAVDALVAARGLSRVVAHLLVARGVTEPAVVEAFMKPSLADSWRSPTELPGMAEAADRVAQAVSGGERIVVFGDFDADGVTAAAVVCRGLAAMGASVDADIPHRSRDGYGLTDSSMARLRENGPDLVVTVDNGITSGREVALLREAGIDVVVTDHHEPGEDIPRDPVVDPKHGEYPFDGLAGAGVALKLVQAVGERLGSKDAHLGLLDLATLGTIGDVVPLLDENRALVAEGMREMRERSRVGVEALAAVAGVECARITSERIAFGLVPRINAAGRMEDARVAFDLLMTDDPQEARRLAERLDTLNKLRRQVEVDLFEQAVSEAEQRVADGVKVLLLAGEEWHEGVRGIVASRLVRRFGLPSLVFTLEDGIASGSGRSVPGLDLHSVVAAQSDRLERFGGHAAAVGLTLPESGLKGLERALDEAISELEIEPEPLVVDAELTLEEIGPGLVAEIDLLEPYGEGNRKPIFGVRGVFLNGRKMVGKNSDHLVFEAFDGVSTIPAIAFRCRDIDELVGHEAATDVAFEVERDEWRGRERVRMLARHVIPEPEDPETPPSASLVEDLFERAPAILARGDYEGIADAESFHTKLAGVTFEGRQDVVTDLVAGVPLRLERQPDNPYDENACALYVPDGRQIGFFNRRLAAVLAFHIDEGLELDVAVTDVTGGGEGESLGVNVLVSHRGDGEEGPDEGSLERRAELAALSPAELDETLRHHFIGDMPLRDAQVQSLQALAAGKNCLTVMATGRGKSLIFHIHAARRAISSDEVSVFVYPLRALVSDQAFHLTESLAALGVTCVTLTGETSLGKRDELFAALGQGGADVVLTTPEFFERHASRFAQTGRIGFVVVDEAHHVGIARSGHRPAYMRLGEAIQAIGSPTVLAVTATASDEVAAIIRSTLRIQEMVLDPCVRDNLRVTDMRGQGDKAGYVASLAARGEKVVVYVNSREQSVRIADGIRKKVPALRYRTSFYNGGLAKGARHAVENAFREGDLRCIVATSAFGEGVNIPDIRHVVHFHLPFNEIEFNQMSGRAGRDGRASYVHLLFGPRDARLNRLILESVAPERDDMAQLYLALKELHEKHPEGFEMTNAELAAKVSEQRPRAKLSEKGVSATLGVFRELGLVESEGTGSYRRLRLLPRPKEKLELSQSVRYAEGVEEQADFEGFREWSLESTPKELLERFDRPILPGE